MTRITESQWITYYGFKRFPFDRPEAGNEEFAKPEFLASCFLEPASFERIFGQADAPVTSLLFADRGTGKTACRVMMDYYCQNGQTIKRDNSGPNFVLSVPHIHLDNVQHLAKERFAQTGQPVEITPEFHVIEIMRKAVQTFVDLVAHRAELADRIRGLSTHDRQDLAQLIMPYTIYLSSAQSTSLGNLGLQTDVPVNQPIRYLRQPAWDSPSQLDHLMMWCSLLHKIGILANYVLVDGVDELTETAGDAALAYALIRPLVTNLRLMDGTPYLAFKFFLPSQIQHQFQIDQAFRPDRGFIIENIVWRIDDLAQILRYRLDALRTADRELRERSETGFSVLCVPEIRGNIEMNIATAANGNPRHLMNLCSLLVKAHCSADVQGQDDPYQLNQKDFETALSVFREKILPSTNLSVPAGSSLKGVGVIDQSYTPVPATELKAKTIRIKEGDTGYSYQNLFGDYLKGARKIYIIDPYIRMDYQIRNFMLFISLLDTSLGQIKLHLTTAAEDSYQQDLTSKKFHDIAASLAKHGVSFTYEFTPAIHDRSIRLDNGWNIYPGRGLDIFQKPETKFDLGEIDQTKRMCRETEVVFLKVENK
jgi:hypothetical protein